LGVSIINSFILTENNGVQYYTIPSFSETGLIKHGFSTRIGGISEEPYQELNLGFLTGDDWEKVKENRRLFAQSLGIPLASIVAANQVHGDKIFKAGTSDCGRGAFEQNTVVKETDALITNEPGVALIAFYADCVPIMFLDPVLKVIAIAHAGWKGTVLNITGKTVEQMGEEYDCQPQNILAAICPSIGPCHYEVDTPVISKFQDDFNQWGKVLKLKSEGKAQLNLWEANRLQLLEAGILDKHITVSEICTYCNPEILYSYRYDKGKTGRLAGIIMLTNK